MESEVLHLLENMCHPTSKLIEDVSLYWQYSFLCNNCKEAFTQGVLVYAAVCNALLITKGRSPWKLMYIEDMEEIVAPSAHQPVMKYFSKYQLIGV